MKHSLLFALSAVLLCPVTLEAQNRIVIPDTDEYQILTGDMHVHTIFSDGSVWPATRVEEAYSEGVEVICMTSAVLPFINSFFPILHLFSEHL